MSGSIDRPVASLKPPPGALLPMADKKEQPYKPAYTGFDVEKTRHAQATADRAQEGAGAQGEDANAAYVDEGPAEAARRMGESEADVGGSVERARRKKR